jgi:surface antigen
MKNLLLLAAAAVALTAASAAYAEPIQIGDDENYSRLAQWEQHLDQRISDGVSHGNIRPGNAWRFQKRLDSIEIHLLQSYYQSDNGLDGRAAHGYADQLRSLGRDMGENNWGGYREDSGYSADNGGGPGYGPPPAPPQSDNYYRQGQYESDCHRGNAVGGTIFGAVAGGLLGSAVSHGNGGAIAGGVILGGAAGNALSRDIDCDDQPYAFSVYDDGLNGPVDREVTWRHNDRYGTFRTTREYREGDRACRDFHTVNYRGGQRIERDGSACRGDDGHWHLR